MLKRLSLIRLGLASVAASTMLATSGHAQILHSFPFLEDAELSTVEPITDVPAIRRAPETTPQPQIDSRNDDLTINEASALLGDQGGLLFPELMTEVTPLQFGDKAQPALSPSAVAGLLDARKRLMAQVAWGYIETNSDPVTGLTSATSGGGTVSLWDIGSTLAAIQSARDLELLSKRAYDRHVQAVLRALLSLEASPLLGLPNRLYSVTDLSPITTSGEPGFDGSSAVDIGRLLVWLDVIRRRAPYFSPAIDQIVARWRYCDLIDSFGQIQFLAADPETGRAMRAAVDWTGYEQYAAKGFALWGFDVSGSLVPTAQAMTELLSVDVPVGARQTGLRHLVDFESYALDGLEFAWDRVGDIGSERGEYSDGWKAEVAHRLFQVQLRRWQSTGALTARGPHYSDGGNRFLYDSIALGERGWQTVDITGAPFNGESVVSTRAAFSMWALWEHAYGDLLFDAVADRYDLTYGFPEGILENGLGPVDSYSLATNASVLQALAFHLKGPAHPGASPISGSALSSGASQLSPALRARNCLPSAPATPLVTRLPLPDALERCEDFGGGTVGNCTL